MHRKVRWAAVLLSAAMALAPVSAYAAEEPASETVSDSTVTEQSAETPDAPNTDTDGETEDDAYMGVTMKNQSSTSESDPDPVLKRIHGAAARVYNNRRNANYTLKKGIDVSHYQGNINWSKVKAAGIDYAIIKIGGRYTKSGKIYSDSYFKQNITGAKAAGLQVGVYFFSAAISEAEAREEAEWTCNAVKGYALDLPVFMDYEYESGYRTANGASFATRTAIITAFCEKTLDKGYHAGIYSGAYLLSHDFDGKSLAEKYWMWVAAYNSRGVTYYSGLYDMWQYSSSGTILGTGSTDMDYWYQGSNVPSSESRFTNNTDAPANSFAVYRVYNPNSGEHFYTPNASEQKDLAKLGWQAEGIAWYSPNSSSTPVYRLYNANGGEHFYTISAAERKTLISCGWRDEGIGWYSDSNQGAPVYRVYNPNMFANNHLFTLSESEKNHLVSLGWKDEGIAWYSVAKS